MTPASSPDERLTALEMSLAHLQHDFDQLNAVALQQQALIEQLQRELQRLQTRLARSDAGELPDLREERPPHY